MYTIQSRAQLCANMIKLEIAAPELARKTQPGQRLVLRPSTNSEPLTIPVADCDPVRGTVTLLFQTIGPRFRSLAEQQPGAQLWRVTGPVGLPMDVQGIRRALVIGGGAGCAMAYPIAKRLYGQGAQVYGILGFRNRESVFLQAEFQAITKRLILVTDDGSCGLRAPVTEPLRQMLEAGEEFDKIFAVGPLSMMKFVSLTADPYGIPTAVSISSAAGGDAPSRVDALDLENAKPIAFPQKFRLFP